MAHSITAESLSSPDSVATPPTDPIALSWLVTMRWASVAAAVAAVSVGERVLGVAPPGTLAVTLIGGATVSNVWFAWWTRRGRSRAVVPGVLVSADVAILSWLLVESGGPLNPVSIFFLVYIVLAALVLGTAWAWVIAVLAVCGYGVLFLTPHPELVAAGAMHQEVGRHFAGMWWAFAATALLVAALVAQLAKSVTRRDEALAVLRDRAARNARLASVAALAAGAAHELSTPLGTIAVTARELERALDGASPRVAADLALIQTEVRRCRAVLDNLGVRAGQPAGEMPQATTVAAIMQDVSGSLNTADRERFAPTLSDDAFDVTWPREAVTRALANLVRNGLQASPPSELVILDAAADTDGYVRLAVVDRGVGLTPVALSRLGEPFFSTRPEGKGLGLGVFVARATVEQLGGSLVFSSTLGQGTSVQIRLPRHLATNHNGAGRSGLT